ncbi:hypothetical protein Tco_0835923 [Tanacetum coccineum]
MVEKRMREFRLMRWLDQRAYGGEPTLALFGSLCSLGPIEDWMTFQKRPGNSVSSIFKSSMGNIHGWRLKFIFVCEGLLFDQPPGLITPFRHGLGWLALGRVLLCIRLSILMVMGLNDPKIVYKMTLHQGPIGGSYGGKGGGGFVVLGGKSLRESKNTCGEVGWVEKMSSMGSKFMVRGEECLEGCVGAGGGEINGGGDDFRVSKSLLGEIPGVVIGENGGETFRVDGGIV